jgi:tryptophan 2,3-dioxygenase
MASEESHVTYAGYLRLPELLALQDPESSSEYELLFIVVHQCAELLFKCALDESKKILTQFGESLDGLAGRISRLTAILQTASGTIKCLEDLTPSQFAQFRPDLGTASGAQSKQFRALEADAEGYREAFLKLLQTRHLLESDYDPEHIMEALRNVYSDSELSVLRDIADALYDYEEAFKDHRWQHLKVVRRVIGNAPGTGGTSGLRFLEERLTTNFFEELTFVRSQIANIRGVRIEKKDSNDKDRSNEQ